MTRCIAAALCAGLVGCGATGDAKSDASLVDASTDGDRADTATDAPSDASLDGPSQTDATDAAADSGDAGFSVATLPGLALWLDAAKGITKNNQNQVSKWADQSGKANDASQNDSNLQPVWGSSVINALPAIHFTNQNVGSLLLIADAPSLQWGTGDFLITIVARFDNNPSDGIATGFGMLYGKVGGSNGFLYFEANNPTGMTAGLWVVLTGDSPFGTTAPLNDNLPRRLGLQRAGATLTLRSQGMALQSVQTSNGDVSATPGSAFIGRHPTAVSAKLNGDIAEIVVVKGSTSAQDLSSLESYLKSKYNL